MDLETNEWMKQMLLEAERRDRIAKVLPLEREDGEGERGLNFLGDILRLPARVVFGDGEVVTRSLIFKALPVSKDSVNLLRTMGFDITEKKMYTNVLPAMKRILKKRRPGSELVWPDCYGINNKGFLLEDLSVIRYSLGDRFVGHDFDHASTTLEYLAIFHALGAVAIENGDVTESDFDGYYLLRSRIIVETVFTNAFRELADLLEHTWKGEWVAVAKNIRIFKQTLTDKMIDLLKTDPCKLKTVCHGDCWVNNIMVKYNRTGRPQSVRFVDFQLSFVGSPSFDLQYYFGNSLREDTIPRKRELVELYHAALDDYLQQFGYRGERLSLEELLESYEHYNVLGVAVAFGIRTMTSLPADQVPDTEGVIKKLAKGSDKPLSPFDIKGEDFVKILKLGITEGIKLGFF